MRNRAGEVVLRLEPEDYHALGGLRAPRSIKVTQPKLGAELEVLFKQEELNLALPEEAFALPAAGGLPSQRVDCSTELKR